MKSILSEYFPAYVRLKKRFRGMWFWFPIVAFLEPSTLPPRKGIFRKWSNTHTVAVKSRNGSTFKCCIAEFFPIIEIYGMGIYECQELDYRRAKNIVDIGANIGVATVWLSEMAPDANVFAIEPDTRSVSLLEENVVNAGISQRTHVLMAAVGGSAGDGVVIRSQVSSTVSHVELAPDPRLETGEVELSKFRPIPILTLSGILDLSGPIDIMKIDCEGSEFVFFESASLSDLARVQNIIGEYHIAHGSFERLKSPLTASGFEVRSLMENDIVGLFVATRTKAS